MRIAEFIPLILRIKIRRLLRFVQDSNCGYRFASKNSHNTNFEFPYEIISYQSTIVKDYDGIDIRLQEAKRANLDIAVPLIDGITVGPGEVFSFYKSVGSVNKKKGYQLGYELHKSGLGQGIGGGLCQLANCIFWVLMHSGFDIIERHHHQFDFFPDKNRKVPFGIGVSIFYNYRDLRLINPFDFSFTIRASIKENILQVKVFSEKCLPARYNIEERNHHFEKKDDVVFRYNDIYRIIDDGKNRQEHLLWKNHCIVKYDIDL